MITESGHQHGGIIVIWNDIVPEGRDNFLEWHSREHIPERVGIPGFLRGQRWFDATSAPQYLTVYDTTGPEVLTSAAYLERLNAPTPWTRRSVADFRNASRAASRLVWASPGGDGGVALTARVFDADADADALAGAWRASWIPALLAMPGVACVRIAATSVAASRVETAERKARVGDLAEPAMTVLVDGYSSAATLRTAFETAVRDLPLLRTARVDTYSLQFSLSASLRPEPKE
ncbi:MAG: hypothetical protein JNM79_26330 [Burkholderiales bacterium]|nr:hypothetical protein [Burkholderiales bacterium]